VQRVAQGQASSDLASAAAGTFPLQQLTQRYTGTELENRIAIAPIGDIIPRRLEIHDAKVYPLGNKETLVDVVVRLSHPSDAATTVGYRTGDGTAVADQGDYVERSGELTFEPGQTEKRISITVSQSRGDFFVHLYEPNGAILATSRARVEVLGGWQNPVQPFDVNGDGRVTALDALRVINHLGIYGPGPLAGLPFNSNSPAWVDTTGDGAATALDALRVINFLAIQSANLVEGEMAEKAHSQDPATLAPLAPILSFEFVQVYEQESLSLGRVEPKRGEGLIRVAIASNQQHTPRTSPSDPPASGRVTEVIAAKQQKSRTPKGARISVDDSRHEARSSLFATEIDWIETGPERRGRWSL
jgi:hypothetical protein